MPQGQPQPQPQPQPKKHDHRHPSNEHYLFTCKACREEDLARSNFAVRNIPEDRLEATTFLIPEAEFDNGVCLEYLKIKYPDAPYIGSTLDLSKLSGWAPDEQIVIVRRDPYPEAPATGWDLKQDRRGVWIQEKLPYKNFVQEIREMAPFSVRDSIQTTKEDRFTKRQMNYQLLIGRLAELMPLPYRPDVPKGKDETVLRFGWAG